MKKLFSLALTLLLIISLCISVGAATESSTGELLIMDSAGRRIVTAPVSDTEVAEQIEDVDEMRNTARSLGVENVEDLEVLNSFEVQEVEPGDYTFSSPAYAGAHIVVMEYVDGEWEVVFEGEVDENGNFTVHIEKAGIFAVLGFYFARISPRTGDQSPLLYAGALLLSAACAAFVLKTRKA